MDSREHHRIAKNIVARVAPEETEIFEEIWLEYSNDPNRSLQQAENTEAELGLGSGLEIDLISLVVIHLIAGVGTKIGEMSAREIVRSIKGRMQDSGGGGIPDEKIESIASAAKEEVERSEESEPSDTSRS